MYDYLIGSKVPTEAVTGELMQSHALLHGLVVFYPQLLIADSATSGLV